MAKKGLGSIGIRKILPTQIDFTKVVSGSAAGPGSFIALSSDGKAVLVNAKNLIDDSLIDHDLLTGFVANEHIDHTSVSITAGDGLTGGGTIAASRTLAIGAGTGITVNADDVAFDPDGGTLSTANADVDHILINDGGVFKRIAPSNINISSFNNDSSFTSNTGDMTGVSISVGTGLDISQTNTTSGDYSATINLDLTEVIASDGANRILTSDGDGTLTAESTITYDGANERLGLGTTSPSVKLDIVGESSNESQVRIAQHQNGSDGPDVRFFTSRGTEASPLAVANDDNIGRINSFAYNGTSYVQAGTFGWNTDGTDGDSYFTLTTRVGGSTANRIEINAAGNIELGGTITSVGSALPVDVGGTGQTQFVNGQLLIGNTTGNTLTAGNITVGSGLDVVNGAGSITINLDLTEITVGSGLDTTATGISLDLTEVIANASTANAVLTSDGDGTLTAETTLTYAGGQLHRHAGALTISSDSDIIIDLDDNDDGSNDSFEIRNGENDTIFHAGEDEKIGIRTTTPNNILEVYHEGSDGSNGISVIRGDTSVVSGDFLGGIGFDSADGNRPSSVLESSAYVGAIASETHSTSDKGGHLVFGTAPTDQNDDTVSSERMRIQQDGNVGIGTTTPGLELDVVGDIRASAAVRVGSGLYHDGDANNYHSFATDQQFFVTNGSTRIKIDADGHVTKPAQPAFSAYLSANQTIPSSTTTVVNFNTELFDQNGDFDTSNNRFVAPVSGKYLFTGTIEFNTIDSSAVDYELVHIRINNQQNIRVIVYDPDALTQTIDVDYGASFAAVVHMDANDQADIIVYSRNDSVTLDGGTPDTGCSFHGYLLG